MPLGSATVDKHTSLMVWVFSKEGKCDKEADLRKLSDSFVSCLYYSLTNPKDGDGGGEEKGGLCRTPGPGRGRGLAGSGAAGAALWGAGRESEAGGARIHLAEGDFTRRRRK